MKPSRTPCRPPLTDLPPPPASRLPSSWTRKLGLRPGFASRSQVSPRTWGGRPMQPLGWNSGCKSSVRGKGDRGTEGNLSTLLTFLPPPEVVQRSLPARTERVTGQPPNAASLSPPPGSPEKQQGPVLTGPLHSTGDSGPTDRAELGAGLLRTCAPAPEVRPTTCCGPPKQRERVRQRKHPRPSLLQPAPGAKAGPRHGPTQTLWRRAQEGTVSSYPGGPSESKPPAADVGKEHPASKASSSAQNTAGAQRQPPRAEPPREGRTGS
ncbi:PREDICTED: proline-rich protein 2-like [Lipotes vexillifer]|uniref:Proline-rich protein 2-like n=1 Tax=Lipotes vexillifer TaxID=118797 RepID=A0A340XXM2_LIPVE|nr:PREDICTED: proline-rich protein 2-like [Lipotes vexillifer]